MKKLLLPVLIVSMFPLYAQPTLTQAVMGQIGDNSTSQLADPSGVSEGSSGTSVSWDFSNLVNTGSPSQSTILDPAATPYGANFPQANRAAAASSGTYAYFKVDGSGYYSYGIQNPSAFMTCSDPEKLLKFPMTYSDVSADVFLCTGQTSDTYDRSGTNSLSADAYGTLVLPTGTYSNVLRIHLTQSYQDSFYALQMIFTYVNNQYWWISPDYKGALLTMWDLEVDGFPYAESLVYNPSPEALTGMEQPAASVRVYPNPAVDVVHITLAGSGSFRIQVMNQLGQLVVSTTTTDPGFQLDVSDWLSGLYVVLIETDDGQQQVRFVKG
jgi:hypothetical protein